MNSTLAQSRTFSRRSFVKGIGALVVCAAAPGLVGSDAADGAISPFLPSLLYLPSAYPVGTGPDVYPTALDSWLAVLADGRVLMKTGKVELGQGTVTASKQLVADELDVGFERILHLQGDTWYTPDQGYTAGSGSTAAQNGFSGLRQAAATARATLLSLASAQLGVPPASLTITDGVVSGGGKSVSYAQLVGGKLFGVPVSASATPKPYTAYTVTGTSVPRDDIPGKMFGNFTFVQSIRVPNMVYGQVVRPPTLDSTLVRIEGFAARPPRGFIHTVVKNNYVAVVATNPWDATVAAGLLRVTWKVALLPAFATYADDLTKTQPQQLQVIQDSSIPSGPNVDTVLASTPASQQLSATYIYPIQAHGSMGTSAATALVDNAHQNAVVWSSTQGVYQLRACLATALGFPLQNVHIIFTEGSGCYGLNKADDAALDAAIISQAVGRPVAIQYTRAGEHRWENFGQPYTMKITAAFHNVGGKAKLSAWRRDAWTNSRGGRPGPPANLASGILMGFPQAPFTGATITTPSEPLNSVDNSNAAPSYIVPAARLTNYTVQRAFLSGPLRSPSRIQNTFANESMADEIAHLAGVDPIDFRLDNLQDPRLIAVIQTAAGMSKWEYRPSASKIGTGRFRSGRGFSAMWYEGNLGYNAAVVRVTVDTRTGNVRVNHVWSAQDCGPAINPDGMRQQAEGCAMQGISRTLIEEVKWDANGITTTDWVKYPVIRFVDMPAFDFQIIDRPTFPAVGAGEVLITNMPAAIANAIFDATGARLRQLPFTPARILAALRG